MIYTVYSLLNPFDLRPFYVGCTSNVAKRFARHKKQDPTFKKEKNDLTEKIRRSGLIPIMNEICFSSDKKLAYEIEKEVSIDLEKNGHKMMCQRHGMSPKNELIERISNSQKGKPRPEQSILKMTETIRSNEYRAKHDPRLKEYNEKRKVKICDQNGVVYESMRDAERKTGCFRVSIKKVLLGEFSQTNGMRFIYV